MAAIEPQCRICQDANPVEELISPCHCRGFSRFVHRDCLEEWRRRNVNQSYYRCEVCHFQYQYYRLRFGKVLESAWTSGFFSLVLMISAIILSGQLSARTCNAIWHYFMHQGPSLLPHRLQILFHGLAWVSLPGWYMFFRALISHGLGDAPALPRISPGPISIYNWPSSSSSSSPAPKSSEEEKKDEQDESKKTKVTKYDSPSLILWLIILVAASASFYKLFTKIHIFCRNYCLRAQRLIENVQ